MKDCGKTKLVEYASDEPCELKSAECVIYEDAISYLSLEGNSTMEEVIQALVLSLADARDRIEYLEQQIEYLEQQINQ